VLGDIDCRAPVLAANGEALRQAQQEQNQWRQDADLRVCRQHADECRAEPHDGHGDQKRVLASDQVANVSEDNRAKGSNGETGAKGREGRQ